MKPLTIIVLLLLSTTILIGQLPLPNFDQTPVWSINVATDIQFENPSNIKIGSAINFCGQAWHPVTQHHQPSNQTFEIGFFRQEDSRAFIRKSTDCADEEYLMYDFSVEEGDTVHVGFTAGPATIPLLVINISTEEYEGVERKKMIMYNLMASTTLGPVFLDWVEGVGCLQHPFFPLVCMSDNCETSYFLKCLQTQDATLYSAGPGCDISSNVRAAPQENSLVFDVSPNPVQRYQMLHLEVTRFSKPPYRLVLFDTNGRKVFSDSFSTDDFSFSPSSCGISYGTYFVRIENSAGEAASKKLVIFP